MIMCLAPLNADPYDHFPNHRPIDFYEDGECEEDFCEINYIKVGGAIVTIGSESSFVPVLGLGRRCECPEMGVDYSLSLGYSTGIGGNKRSVFIYTVPKILALRFVDPCSNFSFYYGGGASWSGIVNNNIHQTFHGVFLEAVLGYELQRKGSVRTFIELEVNQGILAAYRKGKYPSPSAQLTFGMGF
jgi:hypothetical protein